MKFLISFIIFGFVATAIAATVRNKAENQIWKNLEVADTTNVLVTFKNANSKAALSRFESLRLSGREAKLNTMYAILKDHADSVQFDVMSMLKKIGAAKEHHISQLWMSAELIIRNIDKETVELLNNHPDVESLQAEWFIPLDDVMEEYTDAVLDTNSTIQNQWGVAEIRAPQVWDTGNQGQGVVVGVTDTGARHTHVALQSRYRGTRLGTHNYNWFVPSGGSVDAPSDANGHGTHVIGSAVGTNGIGVAPLAEWIHCRGCNGASCSNFDLLGCGNWMGCPTNTAGGAPNCALAPRIVNNSWGGGRGNTFYDQIMISWRAVGIMPIFAAGNAGPACNTVNSPADRPAAIAIGSTANNNVASTFSSRGTAPDGTRSPQVAAPGSSIPSAGHQADNQLRTLSGTSMAAPHAAGLCALILSARPELSVQQVADMLSQGAVGIGPGTPVQTCGGIPATALPNNHVGDGRIDSVFSIQS